MKVLYDDQAFAMQRQGGVSRYVAELINAFRRDPGLGVEPVALVARTANRHALDLGIAKPALALANRQRPQRWANRLVHRRLPAADLLHLSYFDAKLLQRAKRSGCPIAVTVHDMIPEKFPDRFPQGNPHVGKADAVRAADVVLCVSESTRADVLDVYSDLRAVVTVTHLAASGRFTPGLPRVPGLPSSYVLFVGSRSGYKDFGVLAGAFGLVARQRPDLGLVAVGGGAFSAAERAAFADHGVADRVCQVELDDDGLAAAYSNAQAFVCCSRYEGFGIPAVEAMASGAPVVLAETSSLPEVGGDAALYFAPGAADELAERLCQLLGDEAERERRVAASLQQAQRFSWAATAQATAAAYRLALRGGGGTS